MAKSRVIYTEWGQQFAWLPTFIRGKLVWLKTYKYRVGWPTPFMGYIYIERKLNDK